MSSLALLIVCFFILGYICIALEHVISINKAAIALLMMVACWTLFMISPETFLHEDYHGNIKEAVNHLIQLHLGDTATTLFFLMGAMAIVEIVDQNGGFNFVRKSLRTCNKHTLLWRVSFMTFFLSAILDNLTTTIVMIMVLRKLVKNHTDRLIYASMVVIAANSGGAFSPIGDVTTIMLWNAQVITAAGVMMEIFVPSLVSMVIPGLILHYTLHDRLETVDICDDNEVENELTAHERKTIFFMGVGGLIFVPIFHYLTDLPPFVGILLALGMLWLTSEVFYAHLPKTTEDDKMQKRVSKLLSRIDMTTILFFLGILMAVGCLQEIGVLSLMGEWLNDVSNDNHYLVTGTIGVVSSIVDNVPLVAGCMGMYPVTPTGDMAVDGIFWQLLAYCAGVGGSILIIGSAAGVVAMGLERITFGWYIKRITPIAILGYFAGMACYWVIRAIFF